MSLALDTLDALIAEIAQAANTCAVAEGAAWRTCGADAGVGVRLQALQEARAAVFVAEMKALEEAA